MGENFGRLRPVIAKDSSNVLLKLADNKSKNYSFDKVFHPDEVFSEVEPVIKSVLDGYNACIFAYGQTGTGKSFTMEGTPDSPGIVPRAIEAIFKQAMESNHAFRISFSMLEIYLGSLKDLLVTQPTKATDPLPPCLSIHTEPKGGIEIDNLVTIQVNDFNQALRLYRLGCRFRSTASTNSNRTSSRSHCMIRISITCFDAPERRREKNKIWLVDLGGSERVLKTKARGRRLDEGKAINLSLSALGDVIYALQRRKRHVPYRNSKLTQVLKDSLGEDSKTLMLVHVSPKEDDLCETICSLNFATRVKSVHLGHEDSNEARDQKEVSMKNLQQKMKKIEEERLRVRGEIENLSEKLEALTRPAHSFQEQLEVSHSSEEPLSNLKCKKNKVDDVKVAPMSQLPRFMSATLCSRRKSGIHLHNSEGKDRAIRRKRPSSHRAESVTFPVKNKSEYNSEHSISRSSCLVGLNVKNSADYETEYSQETLDCDVKIETFLEQDRSQRTSIRQGAPPGYLEKCGSRKTGKFNTKKFSKVDDWLLHKNEPTIAGFTHRSKRVLTIPIPGKKHRGREPSTAERLCNGPVPAYEFTAENTASLNKMKKQFDVKGDELSIPEVITERPLPMLKDLFEMDSRLDFISSSHTTVGQTVIQMQDFRDRLLIDDNNTSSTPSLPDICCGTLNQYRDDDELYTMSIMQPVKGELYCSESMLRNGGCTFSPSESDNSTVGSKGDSGVSVSISDLDSLCEQASTEIGVNDNEEEELDASFEPFPMETRPSPLTLRSQRALFMNEVNQKDLNMHQKDLNMPYILSQGSTHSEGTCYVLKKKIQILFASALLGLGLYDLGFDNDFFHGLML
ncbi:kinesin-like protein KIN-14T [Citrus sinensis]|uniref:Kinesin-like protein KIN-14T n=1 Tax=Citrus sinensis TaxID=2711 RepID=A0ACB8MU69_CITSI|nr:kinesin-like protein KIN-14T [Citrus sinensis]